MKIETMLNALSWASSGGTGNWMPPRYRPRAKLEYLAMYQRIRTGIMRRYIRLQGENAMLRASVEYWRSEALKGGNDA